MSEKVTVFDTTLRDGEQAAGVCFSVADKIEIAKRLEAMRVDVIEAGFPAASSAEAEAVGAVAITLARYRWHVSTSSSTAATSTCRTS